MINDIFNNNSANLLPSKGVETKYEVEETEVFQILIQFEY